MNPYIFLGEGEVHMVAGVCTAKGHLDQRAILAYHVLLFLH